MNKIKLTPQMEGVITKSKETALMMHRHCVDIDLFFDCFMENLSLSCSVLLDKFEIKQALFDASDEVMYSKKKTKLCSDKLDKKLKNFFENCEESCVELFGIDYIPPEIIFMHFLDVDIAPKAIREVVLSDKALTDDIITDITFSLSDVDISIIDGPEKKQNIKTSNSLDMFEDNKILSQFAENLNIKALDNKFDKIVDFDDKISEIATVLCRKKKPNAILVGSAGTGKTALVEGLVNKIVNGEAPELLSNKVVYSVSLSSMVAGTTFRGQFEERLEEFVKEAKKYNNVILFIDEVHTLVGAGGTGGSSESLEASNMLKPELARGTISCIGATTPNEYNATIKKDSALDRRFERVIVREPSKFQMEEILPTITDYYEEFHNVTYSREFLDQVINYCEIYNPNKHYPDKAVDVIDHCGAQAKVSHFELNPEIKQMQKKIIGLAKEEKDHNKLLLQFQEKLLNWSDETNSKKASVTVEHLDKFFVRKANPLSNNSTLNKVFSDLNKKFSGHNALLSELKQKIFLSNYEVNNQASCPKIFCINGAEKTGKTYLMSILKEKLEISGINIINYNGVHFSDDYAPQKIASVLTSGSSLAEKILMYPNSVIIIDDFDCIHRSAIPLFAQIFKDGKLELSNGECADFSHCKFFLTSNVNKERSLGFNGSSSNPESMVFKELSNHFDANLFLNTLNERGLRRVLWKKLEKVRKNLKVKNISVSFDFNFVKSFVENNSGSELNIESLNNSFDLKINKYIQSELLNGVSKINLKKCQKTH